MKKKYLILLFIILKNYNIEAFLLKPSYIFKVQFPEFFKSKPQIQAYYRGYNLPIKSGICKLPEDTGSMFYIIIAKTISFIKSESNNYLKLKPGSHSKCYRILRNSTAAFNPEQKPWKIQEELQEEQSERLPDNSIIICMDPNYVKELKIDSKNSNKNSKEKVLPIIIIDPEVSESEFNKSLEFSLLASLDINAIHSKVSHQTHNIKNCMISMSSKPTKDIPC